MLHKFRYWLAYYLSYKFAGAHEKPTSDSSYDPKLAHTNHRFTRWLRGMEESTYSHLKLEQADPLPLPTIDASNAEMFNFRSDNKTCPVVIKGLIKDTDAVKNWSAEHFQEKYGDTKLLTLRKPANTGGAYTSFNESLDFTHIPLKDSIKDMLEGKEILYVNNVTQIFHDYPNLVDELNLDTLKTAEPKISPKTWLKINMFMGGPGTGSSLHCAVGGNFFFNVHGRKKWVLIHPKYSKFLKSTPSKDFEFVISGYDMENQSEILKKIPKYEVILEPGDVLYVASWWWHYVKNMTDFTIGCSVRDHSAYWQSFKNNPMFMLMSPYPIRINPLILKLAKLIKGREYLLESSMKSDQDIVHNLTDYQPPSSRTA